MVFLDATTDLAFKKLLGDQSKSDLTISFLNHILKRKDGELITQVTMNNTENLPIAPGDKESYLDISCRDQKGKEYIVEMQKKSEGDFIERSQFYVADGLARQASSEVKYKFLKPVLFLGIVAEFNLFGKKPNYLTHHGITDLETGERTLMHSEFHFIELKKFTKTLDEIKENVADQWIYMIKHAHELHAIPDQLQHSKEIVKAFHVLEFERLTAPERDLYRKQLEREHSAGKIEQTAREEGKLETAQEIARELLVDGMPVAKVAKFTKLSVEVVEKLK